MLPSAFSLWTLCLAFVAAATVARLYKLYVTRVKNRSLPGPPGLPLLGNLLQVFPHRKHMLMYLSTLEDKYGPLFAFDMPGYGRTIVINRPEWLEHMRKNEGIAYGKGDFVLSVFTEFPGSDSALGCEGAKWRLSRRIMKPIFVASAFDGDVSRCMSQVASTARGMLRNVAKRNLAIDFNDFCGRVALEVFCKMALDFDVNLLTTDPSCLTKSHPLMESITFLSEVTSGRLFNPGWRLMEKFDGAGRKFDMARSEFYSFIQEIVNKRKHSEKSLEEQCDFLSALLRDGQVEDPALLCGTIVTLLFAAKDNTQNSMAWAFYELSRSPDWIEKLRQEALSNNAPTRGVQYQDLANYPNHLAVFYETLRLWPGVPKNTRVALKDDVLPAIPEEGFGPVHVARGDYLLWSDYAMMRSERTWGPDAKQFSPARHLDTEGRFVKPPHPRFHGFGAGPRMCPGAQLAAFEFVAFWCGVLPWFELVATDDRARLPTDALTLTMGEPLTVRVALRAAPETGE